MPFLSEASFEASTLAYSGFQSASGSDTETAPSVASDVSYTAQYPSGYLVKPAKEYIFTGKGHISASPNAAPSNRDFVDHLFANDNERDQSFRAHKWESGLRGINSVPNLFTYGIQYAPSPYQVPQAESRMVLFSGLAPGTSISDLMSRIRAGKVLRIIKINNHVVAPCTVMVEFTDPRSAAWCVEATKYMDLSRPNESIEATLVNSHSYPIQAEIQDDLLHGFTRQVVLLDFSQESPSQFLDDLEFIFKNPADVLEDVWLDNGGSLFILFTSVQHASRYYKTTIWRKQRLDPEAFEDDLHRFAPDPCDKPFDVLVHLYLGLRARGPYSSLLEAWKSRKEQEKLNTEVYLAQRRAAQPKFNVNYRNDLSPNDEKANLTLSDRLAALDHSQLSEDPQALLQTAHTYAGVEPEWEAEPHTLALQVPEAGPYGLTNNTDRECEGMIAKWLLPQNDSAYKEPLNRDIDFVSYSEAAAILDEQPFRTYSMDETRYRYSAAFTAQETTDDWKRGEPGYVSSGSDIWEKKDEKEKEEEEGGEEEANEEGEDDDAAISYDYEDDLITL
ncbi:hypothetical protein M426DRAFT_9363 [Hypoxylon sp. CI-4A]|nr:hypothetical protein M426DRAFT_9363 [Hypoxylon sp. CI-4A]